MNEYETFRRLANNRQLPLRAPYAFVPVAEKVLPGPNQNPSHSRPVANGISGTIEMNWENETPLLIGGANDSNDAPFQINGDYFLPGASLRGMIRSIVEIISYGRVNFVDDCMSALRDLEADSWKKRLAMTQNSRRTCGWLFETEEEGQKSYYLVPAERTYKVPINDIVSWISGPENRSVLDWHHASVHRRLNWLGETGLQGLVSSPRFGLDAGERAQLVVSGPTPEEAQSGEKEKVREYLAVWPENPAQVCRKVSTGEKFVRSLNRDSNAHEDNPDTDPEANMDALLARATGFGKGSLEAQLQDPGRHGIPVFWRNPGGDRAQNQPAANTLLSLTAFFRIAYENSLLDVLTRSQKESPNDKRDVLDMAEALFGWVPPEGAEGHVKARRKREQAWRGRVEFGFARHTGGNRRESEAILPGISPRASFYPFYLRPGRKTRHPVDFDNSAAVLAGRKRYPARNAATPPPPIDNEAQRVTVRFLDKGQRFTSVIRVHNVVPEELGALIWALTLGQTGADRGFRHMLGRGKNFGYGQIKASIVSSRLYTLDGNKKITPETAIDAFAGWLNRAKDKPETTKLEAHEPVCRLLNTCHAATGEALNRAGCLAYPKGQTGDNESEKILKAYVSIKKKTIKNGGTAPTAADAEGFIGLPPYPRRKS